MPETLQQGVDRALESVTDPETGLSLPAMGLIYGTRIEGTQVEVTMTTTAHVEAGGEVELESDDGGGGGGGRARAGGEFFGGSVSGGG